MQPVASIEDHIRSPHPKDAAGHRTRRAHRVVGVEDRDGSPKWREPPSSRVYGMVDGDDAANLVIQVDGIAW